MSSLLLRGFALGFAVAAAPGPIFFLCLRRSLIQGRVCGFVSGLGVATADAFYAAIATFGVATLAGAVAAGRRPLALLGGVALVAIGVRIVLRRRTVTEAAEPPSGRGLAWAYVTTLGLTITNPATIVSFIALAAALGLGTGGSFERPAAVVAGVLFGSATWWCLLAIAASILRERVTPRVVGAISLVSGLAIAALGMAALDSVFI